jgi:hypothetical protein
MSEEPDEIVDVYREENEFRREFEASPERELAEVASTALAVVLTRCGGHRAVSGSGSATRWRETAASVAAARGFRAIRAGMAMLAVGYEFEARAMTRVLTELLVHAQAALEDSTGEEARAWVAGERERGISARVRAMTPNTPDAYKMLSRAAHGDPRGIDALMTSDGEGDIIEWGPSHSPHTEDRVVSFALAARDLTVILAQVYDEPVPELNVVDAALERALPGWRARLQ